MPTNYQCCQHSVLDINNVRCDGHIIDGRHPKSAEVLGTRPVRDRTVVPCLHSYLGKRLRKNVQGNKTDKNNKLSSK